MPADVIMPALGMAQETGKVVRWLKQDGELVAKGEPLLEVETDKVTVEIEAPADGTLGGVRVPEGAAVPVGTVSSVARRLIDTTKAALFAAVEQCLPGNHLGDVSNACQRRVEQDGFSVVRSLVGHGIGRDMHEDPQIPNYGEPGTGVELTEGMVLAIEPMVNAGELGLASDGGPYDPCVARGAAFLPFARRRCVAARQLARRGAA